MAGAGRKSIHHRPDVGSVADHFAGRGARTEKGPEIGMDQALARRDSLGRSLGEAIDRPIDDQTGPPGVVDRRSEFVRSGRKRYQHRKGDERNQNPRRKSGDPRSLDLYPQLVWASHFEGRGTRQRQ